MVGWSFIFLDSKYVNLNQIVVIRRSNENKEFPEVGYKYWIYMSDGNPIEIISKRDIEIFEEWGERAMPELKKTLEESMLIGA